MFSFAYKTNSIFMPVAVQSLSHVQLFTTPWTAAHQVPLSFINSRRLLTLTSIELEMPSNHLILCCPLLLPPLIFPSIRIFSSESAPHIRRPKDWSFSFRVGPSNQYSRLISFRIDFYAWNYCFSHRFFTHKKQIFCNLKSVL